MNPAFRLNSLILWNINVCTYLPKRVKMQPEIATKPPSTFSAGFLSNKCPFSEQQLAGNWLYKEQRGRLLQTDPPTPPTILVFTVQLGLGFEMHGQK